MAGWSPLLLAGVGGHTELCRLLIECRAAVAQQDPELARVTVCPNRAAHSRQGVLGWVADGGHAETARVLLESKADPDTPDKHGWTALVIAANHGHVGITEQLLAHRADPFVRDKVHEASALQWAEYTGAVLNTGLLTGWCPADDYEHRQVASLIREEMARYRDPALEQLDQLRSRVGATEGCQRQL